jgi:AcrR family transcriptional regulator
MTEQGKKAGVRERILEAALEVLREAGVHGFTQVRVSKRAAVRQSHLTYYFPTRDDLLEAVITRGVESLACLVGRAVEDDRGGRERLLERLASAVAEPEHMRMFLAMIVEADGDAGVREIMGRSTLRMEAALAEALGGRDAAVHARLVLAAIWGQGLYRFLMRPPTESEPAVAYVSWLVLASGSESH